MYFVNELIMNLVKKMSESNGLECYTINRSVFEGWLQTEAIDFFAKKGLAPIPEKYNLDILIDRFAIEIKAVATNYKNNIADTKGKSITESIRSIIKDVVKLREKTLERIIDKGLIMFVVFPLEFDFGNHTRKNNSDWCMHIKK